MAINPGHLVEAIDGVLTDFRARLMSDMEELKSLRTRIKRRFHYELNS